MSFECKIRGWWKANPEWPDGREPYAKPWDKIPTVARFESEADAREFCRKYNATHEPGPTSIKCEYGEAK